MTARLLVTAARLVSGPLEVTGEDHAYLFLSRRLAVGDAVQVFDGMGREATATVVSVRSDRATLELSEPVTKPRIGPKITILQALIKGERMDWCLEKLVEVGVDRIVPCMTARSVVRLDDDRRTRRAERYQSIAREAARQCGRADVPTVAPVVALEEALRSCAAELRLVAHPGSDNRRLATGDGIAVPTIEILIGPEGGLSAQELDDARNAGFIAVSIGPYVLRSETAGMAAVAVLRAAQGEP
jgi:16S rRNA (uracil1498-N3)-methyltransferase